VAELIIPVTDGNAVPPRQRTLQDDVVYPPYMQGSGAAAPTPGPGALVGGSMAGGTPFGTTNGGGPAGAWTKGTGATREDQLIELIQHTIAPHSWASMGGQGTIDYFPMTMSLVINQTPDIQEQIAELLETLRRLQDAEVAVEIRLI